MEKLTPFQTKNVAIPKKLTLSRFCFIRFVEGKMVLETPLAPVRFTIGKELFSLLEKPEVRSEEDEAIISLLHQGKILVEREEPELETWEFHDLLFHSRSRQGRHNYPYGSVFPFPHLPHPPVCATPLSEHRIPLSTGNGSALAKILDQRESVREKSSCLTLDQLATFLYRCARVKEISQNSHYTYSKRPYPNGGALYELEIYPLIHDCEGIAPGFYHYAPDKHALFLLPNKETESLLQEAGKCASQKEYPRVLFVIAARFPRVSWKYRSLSYALTLKNTGVLLQSMYLVAAEMGLSPVALGGGNSDLFSQTLGSNYYLETSVGEFILN